MANAGHGLQNSDSALAENAATSLAKGTRPTATGRLDQRSWETAEGDKRSKVEVTADEICPSLRWATVQVTRTERGSADAGARRKRGPQLALASWGPWW